MALAEIALAQARGQRPIVVGGTGLYLKALIEGLNQIPPIPAHIRQATREMFEALGAEAFHDQLKRWDPAMANRLPASDSQRMMRAWEVMAATNRSLADWQGEAQTGPPPGMRFDVAVLLPDRQWLYAACEARLDAMVANGALEEVRALLARDLSPEVPVMKAVGVPEFVGYLRGQTDWPTALAQAKSATRRYAKRQLTWLRHQLPPGRADWPDAVHDSHAFPAQYSETLRSEIFAFLRISH
jgi:tRNA dimethylallyltransferase